MSGPSLKFSSRDSFPFIEGVPAFNGLPLFVNTWEMGHKMVQKLGKSRAIIHRGHGMFVVGESIEDAVIAAAALERAAKKQVIASSLGSLLKYGRGEYLKLKVTKLGRSAAVLVQARKSKIQFPFQ